MATRKKYKIVLSEKYVRKSENGKEWFQFPLNISGQLVAIQTIIPLDPYTEPDMEQVRKEAYQKGYETGYKDGYNEPGKNQQEAYQRGLNDAWEVARKFMSEVMDARFRNNFMVEIFECDNAMGAMKVYSASEAIEKIRQYEQEKEEQDGFRQNIQTIVDQCGYTLDEIATVLQKMKESE